MSVCLGRFPEHSWGQWVPYDPIHERHWMYRRECNLMGCAAVEYAHELKASESIVMPEGTDPEGEPDIATGLQKATLEAFWRQAGSTGRSHLVMLRTNGLFVDRSVCGNIRRAAWLPETPKVSRCGSCRRIARFYRVMGSKT